MTLTEQVYAQAVLLAGSVEQEQLLKLFCQSAVTALTGRLREGLTSEDCKADLIAAAALYALAALEETDANANMERIQFGDITLSPGNGGAAARCLRRQAELIIAPFCRDSFSFRGV